MARHGETRFRVSEPKGKEIGMAYVPSLGGHAPGHLRTMLLDYLETDEVRVEDLI